MKKLTFWAVALIAIASMTAFALGARADTLNLRIDSAPYFDGRYFVGPYNSTLLHHDNHDEVDLTFPAITFCIDFEHHVGFGQEFQVRVVNLANFNGPLQQNYWEAGWLALQINVAVANGAAPAIISEMQRAIWLITTPGTSDPYLTTLGAFAWATQASQHYQEVAASTFTLYLREGQAGQSQLAINAVPEPKTYAMIGAGFVALIGFNRLRRRA